MGMDIEFENENESGSAKMQVNFSRQPSIGGICQES